MTTTAWMHFEDGTHFKGVTNLSPDDQKLKDGIWGEAAFTTGMSGYQETMTDPSFLGQHIIFSNSHIGNYPAQEWLNQSNKCHATSLIARHFSANPFIENLGIPLFSKLDTRSLVKYLTSTKASHKSVITGSPKTPSKEEFSSAQLHCSDLDRVSIAKREEIIGGDNPIALIDFGCKGAIVENLKSLGFPLTILPHNTSIEEVTALNPRLIFLSNGPGDPRVMKPQINLVKDLLSLGVPLRGICLGHQLLTLALGAKVIRLPYGQRGVNHPIIDHISGNLIITSQNHGYSTEEKSLIDLGANNPLKREIQVQSSSLFDQSVEGMYTADCFLRSVQYHPEANPGPSDAIHFFSEVKEYLSSNDKESYNIKNNFEKVDLKKKPVNRECPYEKILIIGSGPIKIGQASEFDYSGTQACKSLGSLGVKVVLLNSNPATIMTDPEMAYRTYIEPITKKTIKNIIKKENVDAILSTMGGQTALNICVELEEEGYLKEANVALLGANVNTIKRTEDRELFAHELKKLGYQTGKRFVAQDESEARMLSSTKVGYPLIIRRDFALGGKGAALVHNDGDLMGVINSDIEFPITLEKSLVGWKEIELEVMVDCEQNGVIICSIENVDPCGIHTGDSITVAPAQTISDRCYQKLREISLTVAKHMGVVAGGANVQFAINPHNEDDIVVIEMNPRVSRSSALASKATGYPIAKISALLAIGYTLKEILNDITKASPVAFEPTLDYVAIKIPLFPFKKFPTSSQILGPQMRSVGEVLALGGSFNEAFLKALRSLETGLEIPSLTQLSTNPIEMTEEYLQGRLGEQRQLSLLACLEGLRLGLTTKKINEITNISSWFIEQMEEVYNAETDLRSNPELLEKKENLISYKSLGFSDKYLAFLTNRAHKDIYQLRFNQNIFPVYKAVDTCSGEFQAQTPYFYSTYNEVNEAEPLSKSGKSIVILGSGPNRIGQGIEFDYSCVKSCQHLKSKGISSIMVNSNPETVSTDYDSSDRLYLSPLYSEDLFDILMHENPDGVITSFSGQTGIKIREHIENSFRNDIKKFNFLGPSLECLAQTEDRNLFSLITKKVDLAHTTSMEVKGQKQLRNAMTEIGFPVIIRPSYVIGGESMYIFESYQDISEWPQTLKDLLQSSSTIFQVETYLENALEYDVDLVRDNHGNCVFTVCEHIEHAGVHSGDSGMISPPVVLTSKLYQKMKEISYQLADLLDIKGPINFQYGVKDGLIYCIEANPRGSRTLPFLSKAYHISLPAIATDAMLGEEIQSWDREVSDTFCVKQSTFPFDRFLMDNIILGPKMRSTGETMGFDHDKDKAVLKSYLGNYPSIDEPGKILMSLADRSKEVILPYLKTLVQSGWEIMATRGTYNYVKKQGIPCTLVAKIDEDHPDTIVDILNLVKNHDICMVFNTPQDTGSSKSDGELIRNIAIQNGIPCFTRKENIKAVVESLLGSLDKNGNSISPISLQEVHH